MCIRDRGKRFALPNSEILIHQPLIGGQVGLQGQTTDIKIHADHMAVSYTHLDVYKRQKLDFFDLHCDTVSRLTEGGGIADADAHVNLEKARALGRCV